MQGHGYAVRRAKFSPHVPNVLASVSYDMSCRIWEIQSGTGICKLVHGDHSEFVFGVDWSLFNPGMIATCAWDEKIHIFQT
jgi:peroxin-7